MKKVISILTVIFIVLALSACSSGIPQEEYDKIVAERDSLLKQAEKAGKDPVENTNELQMLPDSESMPESENDSQEVQDNSVTPEGIFNAEVVLSQLEVDSKHYSTDYFNYAFLVIKNNSDYNISITADVTFYDEAGNLIGADSTSQEAVESGYDTILYFMRDKEEKYATMEYELNVEEEDWYECVLSDLSYKVSETEDKIILSVTNNGTEAAEFVEALVLFFNGDAFAGFEQRYVTDNDYELKPGKTLHQEMNCYENFDSYRVFFTGRR